MFPVLQYIIQIGWKILTVILTSLESIFSLRLGSRLRTYLEHNYLLIPSPYILIKYKSEIFIHKVKNTRNLKET